MIIVISPAKSLDFETPAHITQYSQPLFVPEAARLVEVLKKKSSAQIAALMSISDNLATLNVARFAAWQTEFNTDNAKQAILAFNGDVYDGLDAKSLKLAQLAWAQNHLCILSGLYGVLRPLDLMQPYRLEMGTMLKWKNHHGVTQYWRQSNTDYINLRLTQDPDSPILLNLASVEYFKALDVKKLGATVVDCVFQEKRPDGYKIISFSAKKARGLMARYVIEKKLKTVQDLQKFDLDGYAYSAAASSANKLVFRREA